MTQIWHPHVTVAAVIERDGKFLLVEEQADQALVLNQPAGHWEANESLVAAVARETLEETAYAIQPTALIGIYRWPHPRKKHRLSSLCVHRRYFESRCAARLR